MSRIGNRKLSIPAGVSLHLDNGHLTVHGTKGELKLDIPRDVNVEIAEHEVTVTINKPTIKLNQLHGTINALVANMMEGVSKGYEKALEIIGVGYRFNVKGHVLAISAGYSHPVELHIPSDLTVDQISNTEINVKGIDKQRVGEFAANVRKIREPEPYKGKGIRYKGEHIRRKEGKVSK